MERITNKKIIKFYSSKCIEDNLNCTSTYSFENENMQSSGGYIGVANAFINKVENDDKYFYQWLLGKDKDNTMYNLNSLKFLPEDNDFDVFLEKDKVNQKWHCLISWYARLECDGKLTEESYEKEIQVSDETCILKKKNSCPELRLWLVEAAQEEKHITTEDVLEFKREAVSYSKNKQKNLKQWNKLWTKYVTKILHVIKA